ncbi:unnamed protein product, partial [Heterosigma akashiwo]
MSSGDLFGTALSFAIQHSTGTEVLRVLLNAGANVNGREARGRPPLAAAIEKGDFSKVLFLLDAGARLDATRLGPLGNLFDPLNYAMEKDQFRIAQLLIAKSRSKHGTFGTRRYYHRANNSSLRFVHRRSHNQLHHQVAARLPNGHKFLELLADEGADLNICGRRSESALHIAAMHDRPEAIRFLLDQGAPINQQNSEGLTPLLVALKAGRSTAAMALLNWKQQERPSQPPEPPMNLGMVGGVSGLAQGNGPSHFPSATANNPSIVADDWEFRRFLAETFGPANNTSDVAAEDDEFRRFLAENFGTESTPRLPGFEGGNQHTHRGHLIGSGPPENGIGNARHQLFTGPAPLTPPFQPFWMPNDLIPGSGPFGQPGGVGTPYITPYTLPLSPPVLGGLPPTGWPCQPLPSVGAFPGASLQNQPNRRTTLQKRRAMELEG